MSRTTTSRASALGALALGLTLGLAPLCAEALAEPPSERVVLAELTTLTLERSDPEDWPAEDEGRFTLRNSCGVATARFRVLRATAPAGPVLTQSFFLGEYCGAPLDMSQQHYLIVLEADADERLLMLPGFATSQGVGALWDEHEDGSLSPALRRQLTPGPLSEPVPYPPPYDLGAARLEAERRSELEVREDQLWIVRAIPLDRFFRDLTADELWR